MNSLFISYIIMCIASLICVFIGASLTHPKNPSFVIFCYFGYVVFFFGRLYEVARILLDADLYNTFELGFLGIVGAFSFWLSSNFAIKHKVDLKVDKKIITKCLVPALLCYVLYIITLLGTTTTLENIIDFIITLFAGSNVYYYVKNIILINKDKTNTLKELKFYCISGIIFCVLILLLLISFAHNLNILLIIVSVLIGLDLIYMMILFKEGVKKWLAMN